MWKHYLGREMLAGDMVQEVVSVLHKYAANYTVIGHDFIYSYYSLIVFRLLSVFFFFFYVAQKGFA